jgi:hypothetical protein
VAAGNAYYAGLLRGSPEDAQDCGAKASQHSCLDIAASTGLFIVCGITTS